MMNSDRNKAMPMSTWFGGVCAVPSACRSNDRTIMMRVNEVIKIRIDGNSASTVINSSSCKDKLYSVPSSLTSRIFSAGIASADAVRGSRNSAKDASVTPNNL